MKRVLWPAVLVLAGCGGHQQSVIDPAGTQSDRIASLWWFFFWLLSVIFVLVVGVMLRALTRTKTPQPEDRLRRIVGGASVVTAAILLGLIVMSIATGRSISSVGDRKNSLAVEVIGNQWWWYVRYPNDDASRIITTANEIHIPTGRPVMIRATSNDVIHSFWVPNLHGKRDLIPSRVNVEWIEADRPGRYRGQCTEFCGIQHAHMAFWVVAESQSDFEKWSQRQLQPAVPPSDPVKQRGQQVFLANGCVLCHNITGTGAAGQVGPDLTHFGSRISIGAGTLPNTKGNLGGWIADPQNIKPGNHMATVPLKSDEIEPLLQYLESLQ